MAEQLRAVPKILQPTGEFENKKPTLDLYTQFKKDKLEKKMAGDKL